MTRYRVNLKQSNDKWGRLFKFNGYMFADTYSDLFARIRLLLVQNAPIVLLSVVPDKEF